MENKYSFRTYCCGVREFDSLECLKITVIELTDDFNYSSQRLEIFESII